MKLIKIVLLPLVLFTSISTFAEQKSFPIHFNFTMSNVVESVVLTGRDGGPIKCLPDSYLFTSMFGFGSGQRNGEFSTVCEDLAYAENDYISVDIKYQGDSYYNLIPGAVKIHLNKLHEGLPNNCFVFGNLGHEQVRCE